MDLGFSQDFFGIPAFFAKGISVTLTIILNYVLYKLYLKVVVKNNLI